MKYFTTVMLLGGAGACPFANAQASPVRDNAGANAVSPAQDTEAQDTKAQDTKAQDAQGRAIAKLVREMRAARKDTTSLSVTLEYRGTIPGRLDTQPIELRALMRVQSLRLGKAPGEQRYSRLDVDLDTPQGPLRSEKVRTPEGIWIHQASELTGQKWLKMDKATMLRMDRVAEVFGSSGALQSRSGRAGAVIGAELLEGLARSYDLSQGEDVVLDDKPCITVRARLKKTGGSPAADLMPGARPDAVTMHFAKSDWLLRKMIQKSGDKVLATLTLRHVDVNPKLSKERFKLVPPSGVRFVDIMTDKMASVRIRMDLKRLDDHEAKLRRDEEAKKGDKNAVPASGRK